jgi:glutaconate CoA-transferase subunit B
MTPDFTPDEMMTIAASRLLTSDDVCFVGIGAPSAACNVARLTHAPGITLMYESGTIGTAPDVLPLSIGFLGAAQIDRFGNINTTVIGDYHKPKVRLPGGGGAPEIAVSCQQIFITMKQSTRGFVEKIDFFTSLGHGTGGDDRLKTYGVTTKGPMLMVTDLAVWKPDPVTKEFTVHSVHPGATREQVQETCGWKVKWADSVEETVPPTRLELETLRDLKARSKAAHEGPGRKAANG